MSTEKMSNEAQNPALNKGAVSGSALDLDKEWKKFLKKVNPEKWSASEETCYYLAFCTGWWARTGEAAFQADR
jgi:N-acetylglucosamine-6-phosphate deacetylase